MAQGVEEWESMITDSMMNVWSKEYNVRVTKEILNGLPHSI